MRPTEIENSAERRIGFVSSCGWRICAKHTVDSQEICGFVQHSRASSQSKSSKKERQKYQSVERAVRDEEGVVVIRDSNF
jgi:hypothetical protein